MNIRKIQDATTEGSSETWRYFKDPNAPAYPRGCMVMLLTVGKIPVRGHYTNEVDYIAWAPMIKRDKALEERRGL